MARVLAFVITSLIVLGLTIVAVAWFIGTLIGPETLSSIVPALAVVIGILIVIRLVRGLGNAAAPLGDLIEASTRVEAGEVGTQVDVRGPREIRALARAFNSMSDRLAADTRQRRRFLADVSHELRTPLTVMQGGIEGMLDGLYPADRPQLERLLAETRHMERLVEDLRTISLSDAGALQLNREPVDFPALVADVAAGFEPQASADGVALVVDVEEVEPIALDPRRLRQVVGNLLSNALRHTPRGGRITVRVRNAADDVLLDVADSGSGMDVESAERAFDRFWRSGDTAGAGLGLAIVRDLVRAHGGEATIESAPGAGTTVRCRLPRAPAA